MSLDRSGTLARAHAQISACLLQSVGNLRLLAAGAPFTQDIVRLIEADLLAALQTSREAHEIAGDLRARLGAEGER